MMRYDIFVVLHFIIPFHCQVKFHMQVTCNFVIVLQVMANGVLMDNRKLLMIKISIKKPSCCTMKDNTEGAIHFDEKLHQIKYELDTRHIQFDSMKETKSFGGIQLRTSWIELSGFFGDIFNKRSWAEQNLAVFFSNFFLFSLTPPICSFLNCSNGITI